MESPLQLANGSNGPAENGHYITRHSSYLPSTANGSNGPAENGHHHITRHSSYPPSTANGSHGPSENGHHIMRHSSYAPSIKAPLAWLDLKVFYVRITHCEMDGSTPEYLQVNHTPLNRNTLLEVNGSYSDTPSFLRRDRLDKKSEEVTFVCTDSIKLTGSVKFEVFDKDVLLISGVLELLGSSSNGHSNGCNGESESHSQRWNMSLSHEVVNGDGFLKGRPNMGLESGSPRIELSLRKNYSMKGTLGSIPEYEADGTQKNASSGLGLQVSDYPPNYKPENEDYNNLYAGSEFVEGEDGELSWFNAGVRVGVGIGLSVCLGIGIGVGLLVRTYQGTTRNFRRRIL